MRPKPLMAKVGINLSYNVGQEYNRAMIESYALQFLKKGREDWDVPHTRAVVFYAERLANNANLDILVLVTAAWLHDVGYFGLFGDGDSSQLTQVEDKKALHMEIGAKIARKFLESPEMEGKYTADQVEQIVHLVGIHDSLERLTQTDELILMEADTLGAIDLAKVIPTFNKTDGLKYIESLKRRRMPLFTSELGKEYLAQLLPKFETYFREMVVS